MIKVCIKRFFNLFSTPLCRDTAETLKEFVVPRMGDLSRSGGQTEVYIMGLKGLVNKCQEDIDILRKELEHLKATCKCGDREDIKYFAESFKGNPTRRFKNKREK